MITSKQETENSIAIFYAVNSNNNFYWVVKDKNEIFEIRSSDNEHIKNFEGDIKKYIATKEKEYNSVYKEYNLNVNIKPQNFRIISISENPHETNYFQNHLMKYDLSIDFTGKVTANVYYPDEKKGGYDFNLSEDDFNLLKGIISKFSIDSLSQKYFINDDYTAQAIVINDKYILNDYNKMKSDIDIQAVVMFSNLITMKYIAKQKAKNNVYKIKSSEFTKMYKPESL
ncbi:hypothetical protein SDC9_02080 [bioreactor metagenome]|uniref:Uncharacterized protein n=1 Tax=bioreactor metagenome TaxID=1076179 RepID=A0A644SPL3_9ZZZZ